MVFGVVVCLVFSGKKEGIWGDDRSHLLFLISNLQALVHCFVLIKNRKNRKSPNLQQASIAQLGERKTEDLEAPCSIHGRSSVTFRDSIVASIPACHAGDRGSIPRRGATFY